MEEWFTKRFLKRFLSVAMALLLLISLYEPGVISADVIPDVGHELFELDNELGQGFDKPSPDDDETEEGQEQEPDERSPDEVFPEEFEEMSLMRTSGEGFDFGFLHNAVQVRENGNASHGSPVEGYLKTQADDFTLYLARNEREGFQIAYREKDLPARNIMLDVSTFTKGGDRIQAEVFKEEYMHFSEGVWDSAKGKWIQTIDTGLGGFAEALVPYEVSPVEAKKDKWVVFYVDLHTAKGTPAGVYTANITVNDADTGATLQTLSAKAHVWNFVLPEGHYAQTAMGLANTISGYNETTAYLRLNGVSVNSNGTVASKDIALAQSIIEGYYDFLLDHGVSAFELPYGVTDSGEAYGIFKDEQAVRRYMSDPRVTSFSVPLVPYIQLGHPWTPSRERQIRDWYHVVSEKQLWLDKSYFYFLDEPSVGVIHEWGNDYKNRLVPNIKNIWPNANVMTPFGVGNAADFKTHIDFQRGANSILVPNLSQFHGGLNGAIRSAAEEWQKDGGKVWSYPGGHIHGPNFLMYRWDNMDTGIRRRAYFWQTYNYGLDGVLYWNASYWKYPGEPNDAYNPWAYRDAADASIHRGDGYRAIPRAVGAAVDNGDACLLYPGKPLGLDPATPIASLRLKQINSGLNDYDYLKLSEEFLGKAFVDVRLSELGLNITSSADYLSSSGDFEEVRKTIGFALENAMARGHNWGDWERYVDADAHGDGMDLRICRDCKTQESRKTNGSTAIHFDSQGGSYVAPLQLNKGATASKPADPVLEGFVFLGWYLNGMPYNFSTPVTGVVKLTARWGPDVAKLNVSDRISGARASTEVGDVRTSYSMAIDVNNTLWGWGENDKGQLGDGTAQRKLTPTRIMEDAAIVVCGVTSTAVIQTDGTLWVLSDNQQQYISDNVAMVAMALENSAFVKTDGSLYAWGGNWWGTMGTGDQVSATATAPIQPLYVANGVKKVSIGLINMSALKKDGSFWAWGWNAYGQVGDGTKTHRYHPTVILEDVADFACGTVTSFAIKKDGSLWAWGDNFRGQYGNGTQSSVTSPIKVGEGFSELAFGQHHAAAIKTDGSLWAWGHNGYGQRGNGSAGGNQLTPVKVMDSASGIACGTNYTLAVKPNGSLWGWGDNNTGQLGINSTSTQTLPVQIMPPGSMIKTSTPSTVTFDPLGGTPQPAPQTLYPGEKAAIPAAPTKSGAVFMGWHKGGVQSNGGIIYDFNASVADSFTLTADWEYTVTIDTAGGTTTIQSQKVRHGVKVTPPANTPIQAGYTFLGWFKGNTPYDFNVPVTESFILTARWSPVTYTIAFNANGGSPIPSSQTVSHGSKIVKPADPTRSGYLFAGWLKDGVPYNFDATVTSGFTLTAGWTMSSYTVVFSANGGSPTPSSQTVSHGAKVVKPSDPTRAGYTFAGWLKDGISYNFDTSVTSGFTLTAGWTINSYTITFLANGGNPTPPSQIVSYGGKAVKPTDPTRVGYIFAGWYKGDTLYNFDTPVTETVALAARWTPNPTYTVHFDAAGGTPTPSYQAISHGGIVTMPANPYRLGFSFAGWYRNNALYNFAESVTTDFTLTARWNAVAIHSVTYHFYAGSSTQWVNNGERIQEWQAPARPGYTFKGWYTTSSGSTRYDFNKPITANVAIYAQWVINSYNITFNTDGGNAIAARVVNHGAKVAKPANNPTKAGHTFVGWSRDGVTMYNFNDLVTESFTLIAIWRINTYTVTFDSNSGTPVPKDMIPFGNTVSQPATTRVGYTFKGWYTTKTGSTLYDFSRPITANITVYAQWTQNKYTVTFNTDGGSNVNPVTVNGAAKVTRPKTNPTKAGHTFVNWYRNGVVYNFNDPVTENFTLNAVWTINSYTVTFNSASGSAVPKATVVYGNTVPVPITTRLGYAFKGWYTTSSGSTLYDFNKAVTANITIYAQWTQNTYTVTFNSNGGSSVNSTNVKGAAKVTKPKNPTRAGYTFVGWYKNGVAYNFNDPVGENFTLVAVWK